MAYKHANLEELFIGIADAIREKTGSSDDICADDFPDAISEISVGNSSEEKQFVFGEITVGTDEVTVSGLNFTPNNYILFHMPSTDFAEYSAYYSAAGITEGQLISPISYVYHINGDCKVGLVAPSASGTDGLYSTDIYSAAILLYVTDWQAFNDESITTDGFTITAGDATVDVDIGGATYSVDVNTSFEGSTWGYICWTN